MFACHWAVDMHNTKTDFFHADLYEYLPKRYNNSHNVWQRASTFFNV